MATPVIPSRPSSPNAPASSLDPAQSPPKDRLSSSHAVPIDNASTPALSSKAVKPESPAMTTPVTSDTDQAVYKKPKLEHASSTNVPSQAPSNPQPSIQSNIQPNIQPNTQPNIQPNTQPNIQPNTQPTQAIQAQSQASSHGPPIQPKEETIPATPTPGPSNSCSAAQSPSMSAGELGKDGIRPSGSTVCLNCLTTTTPLWRRDEHGQILCNACGLFLKLHGRRRPISLKTDVIKSRNRSRNGTQGRRFARKGRSPGSSVDQSPHTGPLPMDYAHIDVLSLRDRNGKPGTPTGSDSSVSSTGSNRSASQPQPGPQSQQLNPQSQPQQQPQQQQQQQQPQPQQRPVRVRPGHIQYGISPAGSPALAPQHGGPIPAMGYVTQMMAPPGASPAPGAYGFYSNTPMMGPQTGAVPPLSALAMHAPLSPAMPMRPSSPPDIRLVRGHMSEQLLPRSPPGGERIVPLGQIPAAQVPQDQTVPRSRDLQTRITELELVNDMFRRRIADLEFSEAQARKSAAEAWAIVESVRPFPATVKAEAEARAQAQAQAEIQARAQAQTQSAPPQLAPQPAPQLAPQPAPQLAPQRAPQPAPQQQQQQHYPVGSPAIRSPAVVPAVVPAVAPAHILPSPQQQYAGGLPPLHSLHSLVIAAQHAQPAESPAVQPLQPAQTVPARPLQEPRAEPELAGSAHTPKSATATPVDVGKPPLVLPEAQNAPTQPSPVDSPQVGYAQPAPATPVATDHDALAAMHAMHGDRSPPLQRAFPHLGRSTPNGRLSTVLEPAKGDVQLAQLPIQPQPPQQQQQQQQQQAEDTPKAVKRIRVSELL